MKSPCIFFSNRFEKFESTCALFSNFPPIGPMPIIRQPKLMHMKLYTLYSTHCLAPHHGQAQGVLAWRTSGHEGIAWWRHWCPADCTTAGGVSKFINKVRKTGSMDCRQERGRRQWSKALGKDHQGVFGWTKHWNYGVASTKPWLKPNRASGG